MDVANILLQYNHNPPGWLCEMIQFFLIESQISKANVSL